MGDLLGAPMPEWTTLRVSKDLHGQFIKDAGYRLDGRDVFASRVIHAADIEVAQSEVLQHVQDDGNYSRIPLLFAVWYLCNAEDIQFLYDSGADNAIVSVDHGFWFGSHERPWGFGEPDERYGRPNVPGLRVPIPSEHWDKAIMRLDRIDETLEERIRVRMPINWEIDDKLIAKIASYVGTRKDYTRSQLETLRETKGRW